MSERRSEIPSELVGYASRTGTKRNLRALRDAGWRLLVSATGPLRNEGFKYALDNGAWTAYRNGSPFDENAFMTALQKLGRDADWTVLPDIVEGGLKSLEMSKKWMGVVLGECERALLAVQDGMSPADVLGLVSPRVGIFVGGSTEWKERTMDQWADIARSCGAWVHVGRVNSKRRIHMCSLAGVHSFDGTSVSRFAITLPRLDAARRQLSLDWRN